jgi:CheY-like chemotaxis protein
MKSGPVILIEDDEDDKEVFQDILTELGIKNPIIWFQNCEEAFSFLQTTSEQPFIIFCDLNIPGLSGIDCKRKIDDDKELRKKSIPFVFLSTTVDQRTVNDAYTQMIVQGFFKKKNTFSELKGTIKLIVDYWEECKHPNTV